jgi:hypothetical protein
MPAAAAAGSSAPRSTSNFYNPTGARVPRYSIGSSTMTVLSPTAAAAGDGYSQRGRPIERNGRPLGSDGRARSPAALAFLRREEERQTHRSRSRSRNRKTNAAGGGDRDRGGYGGGGAAGGNPMGGGARRTRRNRMAKRRYTKTRKANRKVAVRHRRTIRKRK